MTNNKMMSIADAAGVITAGDYQDAKNEVAQRNVMLREAVEKHRAARFKKSFERMNANLTGERG